MHIIGDIVVTQKHALGVRSLFMNKIVYSDVYSQNLEDKAVINVAITIPGFVNMPDIVQQDLGNDCSKRGKAQHIGEGS